MIINKKLIKFNYSSRNNVKIKYIVIHDTGNTGLGAGAENHFKYFNGGNRNASAHYFVDDKQVLQLVEDSNSAWHVGDGKGKYGITNSNSLGIEICINRDGNYDEAVKKTIELVQFLMKKYNIPTSGVVRHYDASRKNCPQTMRANNWQKWNEFKEKVNGKEKVKVNILGRVIELEGYLENGTNYVQVDTGKKKEFLPIRNIAESMGLVVGWDNTKRQVTLR